MRTRALQVVPARRRSTGRPERATAEATFGVATQKSRVRATKQFRGARRLHLPNLWTRRGRDVKNAQSRGARGLREPSMRTVPGPSRR